MKRTRVVVSGRVQGVFFRATCARLARRAGLAGTVRNLDDGRVEAIFEGDDQAVDRLVAWCGRGPDHAHVEDVDVTPEDPVGEPGFRVVGR
jgi:acylphosphatase